MSDCFGGLDKVCYDDKSAVRRALISEVAADDTYAEMLRFSKNPDVTAVIKEIQADEQNHQGRLVALIARLEGGDTSGFAKQLGAGLEGREVTE